MAFVLNAIIKIGKYTFKGVNEVVINKSIYAYISTGKITIPANCQVESISNSINAVLKLVGLGDNSIPDETYSLIQTRTLFKEGDKVSIDLGYNGDLRNEFRGFVRRVNTDTPLVIDLEGYGWQLRKKVINHTWPGKTTIKEILTYIIAGTDIVLSTEIPVINLTDFHIGNKTALELLDYFKSKMRLTVYFDDNVLYVGLQLLMINYLKPENVKKHVFYKLGVNTIKSAELKERLAAETPLLVQIKTKGKNGKYTVYQAGTPGGDLFKETIPFSSDQNYLKQIAAEVLNRRSYNGYEGKISAFLQPYCQPAWKATINGGSQNTKDGKTNGKIISFADGDYFIAGTQVKYGVNGARRMVEISYRLDSRHCRMVRQQPLANNYKRQSQLNQ